MGVGSKLIRGLVVVAVAGCMALASIAPLGAQEEPQLSGLTVSVTLGLNGWVDTRGDNLGVVDITSDELFLGRLEIKVSGRTTATEVEVPAGSTKRYTLDLPSFSSSRQATVVITRGDGDQAEEVYSDQVRVKVAADQLVVAVWDVDEAVAPLRSAKTVPTGRDVVAEAVDATQAIRSG
ncbi:MAG: hypothetical protein HKO87_09600, partial [Acidimicrobiia bacterium]|nr:hypothetical protein [Acidimicrobiia bacterium]